MDEEERGAVHAVGLLRALVEQAMQENGLADLRGAATSAQKRGTCLE